MTKNAWLALFVLVVLALPAHAQGYLTAGGVSIDDIGNAAMGGTMGIVKWFIAFAVIAVGIIAAVGHHFYTSALLLFASIVIIFAGPGWLQKIPGWSTLGSF